MVCKMRYVAATKGYRRCALALLFCVLLVMFCTASWGVLASWSAGVGKDERVAPLLFVETSDDWFHAHGSGIMHRAVSHDTPSMFMHLRGIDSGTLRHQALPAVDATRIGSALAKLLLDSEPYPLQDGDIRVDVSDPQNPVVVLPGMTIRFGSENVVDQWERIMHVRNVRSVGSSFGHEWDVRFPNIVIVRESQ